MAEETPVQATADRAGQDWRAAPEGLSALVPAFFEVVGGAALAVGIVGITRSGTDVWLGAFLVIVAVPLALKGRHAASRVLEGALSELDARLGRSVAGEVENVLARRGLFPSRGRGRWWRRLFGG